MSRLYPAWLIALLVVLPASTRAGPTLLPPIGVQFFANTRANWAEHNEGTERRVEALLRSEASAHRVEWRVERLAQDGRHVFSSEVHAVEVTPTHGPCRSIEVTAQLEKPWEEREWEQVSRRGVSVRLAVAEGGLEGQLPGFLEERPKLRATGGSPLDFCTRAPAGCREHEGRAVVMHEAGAKLRTGGSGMLVFDCAEQLRDPGYCERWWEDARNRRLAERVDRWRCEAVMIAQQREGQLEVELSVVGRDGSVWASATDRATDRHRNAQAFAGAVVTVPADVVGMTLQTVYTATVVILLAPLAFFL